MRSARGRTQLPAAKPTIFATFATSKFALAILRTENKLQLTADQPPPSSSASSSSCSTIMNSIWPREGQSVIGEKEKVGKKKVVHKTKKNHPSPPTTPHAALLRGISPRFPAGWRRIGVNRAELEEREGGKRQVFHVEERGLTDPDSIFDYLTFRGCRSKFLVCMPPADWPLLALVFAP